MKNKSYKVIKILQISLLILCVISLASLITGIQAANYNSISGWRIQRFEGWARLVPVLALAVFFFWFIANRKRHLIGYWIGVLIGCVSIAWNAFMIIPALMSGDGINYSLWYAFTQLIKVAIIGFLFWKFWLPLKDYFSGESGGEETIPSSSG